MIRILIFSTFLIQSSMANVLFNTTTKIETTIEELATTLADDAVVVLGEYHSIAKIQTAEAEIIKKVVTTKKLESNFTVGWEFLDYVDQVNISNLYDVYKTNKIDEMALLNGLYPNVKDVNYYLPYLDFFKVSKELDGEVIGLNAPRSMKRVITKKGIEHMDPELVPANMERGSDDYFDRFLQAMGGHAPNEMIERYFMAQSYTDSVMAWFLAEDSSYDFRFVIVGSFHTDYNDGLVSQIKKDTESQVVTIKIVDPSMFEEADLEAMKNGHEKYGQIADYIYILK